MWLVLYVFLPAEQSMRAVRHVEMSLLNMAGVYVPRRKNYQYARIVPVDSGVNMLLLFMLLLLL